MRKLMLALVVGSGFFASALTVEAVSGGTADVLPASVGDTPPDKPGGDDDPPDKPGGGEGGGGTEGTVTLTGVLQLDGGSATYSGGTLSSTNTDENVILAQTNGTSLSVSNYTLNKSGDCTSEDNSNFYAVNAVVAARSGANIFIDNSTLNSNADGANCLFATESGSAIYAYNCTITSTKDSSRGLDATYDGTVIASKLSINTSGSHCAALATDRGDGSISVTDSTLATAGQGSPLIYSTGVIEANGVTGTATGAQIAGIEGLSVIRIKNSNLSGSGEKASEPVANGVIIYQSMSGDSTEGTATFEVSDSTLKSAISGGAMFYITNSKADIRIQDTELDFDSTNNVLLNAAGNDGTHGWGSAGSNGAEVVLTAINQSLAGNIAVDGISSVDMYLVDSTYTGTFVKDATNSGEGEVKLHINSNSTWTVTADCALSGLTVAADARILDVDKKTVSIVNTSGTKHVDGTSERTIIVSDYALETVVATNAITDFEIDRSSFEEKYGTSQSQGGGGGSGGAEDHDGWVYYFKPYPPENAIVKVRVEGATEYGTPDKDHKYCLDGYWNEETGVKVRLLYRTQKGYLFPDGCTSNVWETTITNNAQEVYPPDGVVAVRAQAHRGNDYYLTLKEAIETASGGGKGGAEVSLNDNVTLSETLVVTNSITLDLATNTVTLSSGLTQAFHFAASATVSNGTINSSLAANADGSVLMRFTDCKATLKDLTINGRGYESVIMHDSDKDATDKYKSNKVSDTITCDSIAITGNGCLLSVDYAEAMLTNNCSLIADHTLASFGDLHEAAVYCSGNGSVTIADGAYSAPKVLQSGSLGGKIIVNGGTFSGQIYSWMSVGAHANLEKYESYKAQFALNAGTYTDATIAFAYADARTLDKFTKGDAVTIAAPSGYVWENNVLVQGPVTPGVSSEPYSDALSATNAAAQINDNKADSIAVPTGVGDSFKTAYLTKVEATVTRDNRVVVDLTPEAAVAEQEIVDAAIANETVFASLVSTNASAKAAIATTTPGLYYWIEGGTDINTITELGPSELSTNGGLIELSKPTLDAKEDKAFFRIAVGVSAPAQPADD